MEIKGEEFLKKVQIKQEQDELEQRLNRLNEAVNAYESDNGNDIPTRPSPQAQQAAQTQQQVHMSAYAAQQAKLQEAIDNEDQEYSDIMLGAAPSSNSNAQNKKKYLILGLALVILFLITIILIRLLTSDSNENDSFSKTEDINQEKVLENENIDEQYQKIINEKLKSIKEENEQNQADEQTTVSTPNTLDLEKIEQEETVIAPVAKPSKPDVFDIKDDKKIEPKPVVKEVKKVEPKPVVKEVKVEPKKATPAPKPNVSSATPKGTFVQIGAFTKMPDSKYLQNITQKGFNYKIFKTEIKGKTYHKVLIGPYSSRGQAKLASTDIKQKLNAGTFIIKF